VGGKLIFDGKSVKGRICYSALMVLLSVFAMRDGAEFPWAENKDMLYDACSYGDNTVMFEIKRVRK